MPSTSSNSTSVGRRTRTMTEKGELYQKETFEGRVTKLGRRIDRVISAVSNAHSSGNHKEVSLKMKELNNLQVEFNDACSRLIELGAGGIERYQKEVNAAIKTVQISSFTDDSKAKEIVQEEIEDTTLSKHFSHPVKTAMVQSGESTLHHLCETKCADEQKDESKSEAAFNNCVLLLRSNLKNFDISLLAGDENAIKQGSVTIVDNLRNLKANSQEVLCNFDTEQAALQEAFMERIQNECQLRITQAETWVEQNVISVPVKTNEAIPGRKPKSNVPEEDGGERSLPGSNHALADSLKLLPPTNVDTKVNEWLLHQEPAGSKGSGISRGSKSRKTKSSRSSSSVASVSQQLKILQVFKDRLGKQLQLIESVMKTGDSELIRKESTNLDKMYENFSDSYTRLLEMSKEEELPEDLKDVIHIDTNVFEVKQRMCLWLVENKDRISSKSSHSQSKITSSRKSSSSSHQSSMRSCSEQDEPSQNASSGRKHPQDEPFVKEKETITSSVKRCEMIQSRTSGAIFTREGATCDGQKAQRKREDRQHNKNESSPISVLEATKDMMKLMRAPASEIDKFGGDPLEFEYFKATFKEAVERLVPDQRGRLTRLIKYTSGEAKELIKHCVHADSTVCYDKAMKMLDAEYGSPHIIVSAHLKELEKWPTVKCTDAAEFRKLYRFLLRCQIYKSEARLQELDSSTTLRHIVHKLSSFLQEEWSILAERTRRSGRSVNFDDLVEFVDFHSARASDPAYSKAAMSTGDKEREKHPIKGFNSKLKTADEHKTQSDNHCSLCKKLHNLEDCQIYGSKDLEGKRATIAELHLCFKCLTPTTPKHFARICKNRLACNTCGKLHPTSLHDPNFSSRFKGGPSNEISSHTTRMETEVTEERSKLENDFGSQSAQRISSNSVQHKGNIESNISLCILPVYISHVDHPEKEIKMYAMIDNDCTSCFVINEVMEALAPDEIRKAHITVETINCTSELQTIALNGLTVRPCTEYSNHHSSENILLPTSYGFEGLPLNKNEVPTPENLKRWQYLSKMFPEMSRFDENISLGIMIGGSCPKALEPLEVIGCQDNGPYAYRTRLGWCTVGPLCKSGDTIDGAFSCHKVKASQLSIQIPSQDIVTGKLSHHHFTEPTTIKESSINHALTEMYNLEFNEVNGDLEGLSNEDDRFLHMMQDEVRMVDGHYELPLPFKEWNVVMPNNRSQAEKRLKSIQRKMERSEEFKGHYVEFMENLIQKGYAKQCNSEPEAEGKVWYLPHHGVYHPTKGKLRVVFDCGAKHRGVSLNEKLLQGPDLTNSLIGVLLRFRKHRIAMMADIEAMFYQVKVPPSQRSFLRFLWWRDGNFDNEPDIFEMTVHIFGALSSPSCSNFALRQAAMDFKSKYGLDVAYSLERNFYVDDLLKSLEDEDQAISLLSRLLKNCEEGGFNLTKIISNSESVMNSVPEEKRAPSFQSSELPKSLPIERALGVQWSVENDDFGFRITVDDHPLTRRGILSSISSIYDPLGLASPFLLKGRKILQEITADKYQWDDPVSSDHLHAWTQWRSELPLLEKLSIRRCIKPDHIDTLSDISLHSFSDASLFGYGQATYLRCEKSSGQVSVSLVMGKSRVSPLKATTVPRLELTAALLSCNIGKLVKSELEMENIRAIFWVDSKIVLGYIYNDSKRFKIYVANRIRKIKDETTKEQWRYINTKENPGDDASRGLSIKQAERVSRWFNGPDFLYKPKESWPEESTCGNVPVDDPELKSEIKVNIIAVRAKNDVLSSIERISSWYKQRRVLSSVIRFIRKCQKKEVPVRVSLAELEEAEVILLRLIQQKYLFDEVEKVRCNKSPSSTAISQLNPFIDENGLLKVGGRLSNADFLDEKNKFPVILPKEGCHTIIEWHHQETQHSGRTSTVNALRQNGYWVLSVNAQVRRIIYNCFRCRFLRGRVGEQKMGNLPENRTTAEAPFTNCGVDMFGPFYIKEGRKELKRYCAIFTCFSLRAVHIETTATMDTDSFILALRRFLNRRGPVRSIRSDNGGNFIGTENEYSQEFKRMDQNKVTKFLLNKECDWIIWERNPPYTSHAGGVWERMIKSVRNVFNALLKEHANRLNEEQFQTFMIEAEAIVNSRPLTVENLNDPDSLPITPNQLLTMKAKVVLPPPGTFQKNDLYCRRRWRAVQYLADEFWQRWRKEFLIIQQDRQKWKKNKRNFAVGDVVLVKDSDLPRNQWCTARITEVFHGKDGLVRSANVRLPLTDNTLLRSITKLILIVGEDEQ